MAAKKQVNQTERRIMGLAIKRLTRVWVEEQSAIPSPWLNDILDQRNCKPDSETLSTTEYNFEHFPHSQCDKQYRHTVC
jgi:hypothetical protein